MKRKSISCKVRFDVFKRDEFQCQYCGRTPPVVILEVDHINPVAKGGDNDTDNLVTACFDCNRGKSSNLLSNIPESLADKAKRTDEAEKQLKEYIKIRKRKSRRIATDAKKVTDVFEAYFANSTLTSGSETTIKQRFLSKIDVFTLVENMEFACARLQYEEPDEAFKYFCGICWNQIREAGNA